MTPPLPLPLMGGERLRTDCRGKPRRGEKNTGRGFTPACALASPSGLCCDGGGTDGVFSAEFEAEKTPPLPLPFLRPVGSKRPQRSERMGGEWLRTACRGSYYAFHLQSPIIIICKI